MSTQITGWCGCGSTWTINCSDDAEARAMHDDMRLAHVDEDCKPVDRDEYRRIRARQRRQEAKAFG